LEPEGRGVFDGILDSLAQREQLRDEYRSRHDPIADDRLLWRAHTFRHLTHLLPGQKILELGCSDGAFTRQLLNVSRGENPITAVSFSRRPRPANLPDSIEYLAGADELQRLKGGRFDFVTGIDLLDRHSCADLLQELLNCLNPGGQVVFFESNPWNAVLRLRRWVSSRFGSPDRRALMSRPELYELMSEIGLIRIFAVYTDFVYAPLTRKMAWLFKNLSVVLENAPVVRTLAGAIVVHAQKPPRAVQRAAKLPCTNFDLRAGVSVVVPCHNEEMNIGPLVKSIEELFGAYLHEIIAVDDNSSDRTRQVIEELAADNPRVKLVARMPPNGVGRALADGYRAATGRWILSMDSDFQHLLPEVRDLFDAATSEWDVIVGSRFSRHSVLLNYPVAKICANRAFHVAAQIALRRRFRDVTNNLKLMRREIADCLVLREPGFAVNAETGLQPFLLGARVREVPISWINRTPDMGASSFRLLRFAGGYWRVLMNLWMRSALDSGPYRTLRVGSLEHKGGNSGQSPVASEHEPQRN
jgi:dolichol-phosphate mannosyltransferase